MNCSDPAKRNRERKRLLPEFRLALTDLLVLVAIPLGESWLVISFDMAPLSGEAVR